MALEQTGLSSVLTFHERSAVSAMGRAGKAFSNLEKASKNASATVIVSTGKLKQMSAASRALGGNLNRVARALRMVGSVAQRAGAIISRAGMSMTNMGRSLGYGALVMAPFTLGLKKAGSAAAEFEDAMKGIEAVNPANTQGLQQVEKEALRLGRTTKFTATEVAGSMEMLRRAGVELPDIMNLAAPATSLAAAGNVNLEEATKSLVKVTKGLGLEFSNSQEIIDKLAVSSRQYTPNLEQMTQAMTYTVGTVRSLKVPMEQAMAALGQVGEVTKEGSRSGTSLNAMLATLAAKAKKGRVEIGGLSIKLVKTADGGLDLLNSVAAINDALSKKFPDAIERSGVAARFFQKRAGRAFDALAGDIDRLLKSTNSIETEFKGAAKAMADTRLESFTGQVTLLTSALNSLNIEFFSKAMKGLLPHITALHKVVGDIVDGMDLWRKIMDDTTPDAEWLKAVDDFSKLGSTVKSVAEGLSLASEDIKKALDDTLTSVKNFAKDGLRALGIEGELTAADLVRFAADLAVIAGVLAPFMAVGSIILVMLGTLVSAVSGLIIIFTTLKGVTAAMLGAALLPFLKVILVIGAVIGLAALAFKAFQRDGESTGETLQRLWATVIKPFIDGIKKGFMEVWPTIKETWEMTYGIIMWGINAIADAFRPVIESLFGATTATEGLGKVVGLVAGLFVWALSLAVTGIALLITATLKAASLFQRVLNFFILDTIKLIAFNISEMVDAIREIYSGDILSGLLRFANALFSTLITPMASFVRLLFDAAEAVLGIKIPASVRRFVEAPEFDKPKGAKPTVTVEQLEAAKSKDVNVKVENENKNETTVKTQINLDGDVVASTMSKHQDDLRKRSGFTPNRWQRRLVAEQSAISLT